MNVKLGWCTLAMLGLVGCGNSGSAVVNSNPTNIKSAPAGVATLGFLDMEGTLQVSNLPSTPAGSTVTAPEGDKRDAEASSLPSCIQMTQNGNVYTYTFTNCVAANGGTLNGSITATQTVSGATLTYKMKFNNLISALDANHQTVYNGTQIATITGTQGTLTSDAMGVTSTYTDATNAANNVTYTFVPMLSVNWANPANVWMDGSYSFTQPSNGEVITVTVPTTTPLTWTTGCNYPTSGTLNLALTNSPAGSASATAIFGPTCGAVSIDGATITAGSNQ